MSLPLDEKPQQKEGEDYPRTSAGYPNAATMYQRAITVNKSSIDLTLNIIFGCIRAAAQRGDFSTEITFERDRSKEDDEVMNVMENKVLRKNITNQIKALNYTYDQSHTRDYWKLTIYWGDGYYGGLNR